MPIPEISALPTAPQRTDTPDDFIAKADAFVAALTDLPTEINAFSAYVAALAASLGVSSADAQLLALASLSPTAGDVPYFTSSTAAALFASSSFGRGLAALADAAALRTAAGVYSTAQVDAAIATAVTGLLEFKGSTSCASNPNYPAASKGDAYVVTAAGKIGGASGKSVDIGDWYIATADNAGGTEASVGTSWSVIEHNIDPTTLTPVGTVISVAMSSAPSGYLKCDGSAVSRTTYAALYAAIGTTYGSGDGSTTFNVPDLRGEFVRGWDDGKGTDSGRSLGSAQADSLKAHTHAAQGNPGSGGGTLFQTTGGANTTPTATESTGSTETRPRNIALLYCIKT